MKAWPTPAAQLAAVRKYGLEPKLLDGYNDPKYEVHAGYNGYNNDIRAFVIHDTGTGVPASKLKNTHSLQWILTGNKSSRGTVRACHWYVARDGTLYFVYAYRTWHVGKSDSMFGMPVDQANRFTQGVEVESQGGGVKDLTDAQIATTVKLAAAWAALTGLPIDRIIQHKTISAKRQGKVDTAYSMDFWRDKIKLVKPSAPTKPPTIKPPQPSVPGKLAPWNSAMKPGNTHKAIKDLQSVLIKNGYKIPDGPTTFYGKQTQAAVIAFHKKHPKFASKKTDPAIGPKGWKFLQEKIGRR
jgi:N-acetyl-anhydromuramyl-L-alanine amidase AmpD